MDLNIFFHKNILQMLSAKVNYTYSHRYVLIVRREIYSSYEYQMLCGLSSYQHMHIASKDLINDDKDLFYKYENCNCEEKTMFA